MAKKKESEGKSDPKAMPVSDMDNKWRAEDDVRTLTRAEEIKADAQRMKAAAEMAEEKAEEMNSVIASMAKRGLISDRQRQKIKKGKPGAAAAAAG